MRVLCFAGALRAGSTSKRLVQEAIRILDAEDGVVTEYLDLKDYPFPVYDTDIEQTEGIPDSIHALGVRVQAADALIIASPEYNGGISSVLKTAVDWLSRIKPAPLTGKFLLLLSTSPSGSGGITGLWHTRLPFEALGVHVFPLMVAVPRSHDAFDASGQLADKKAEQKLKDTARDFVHHVAHHHPRRATSPAMTN
jgi:NAD(P)H-dependent FMN reductase